MEPIKIKAQFFIVYGGDDKGLRVRFADALLANVPSDEKDPLAYFRRTLPEAVRLGCAPLTGWWQAWERSTLLAKSDSAPDKLPDFFTLA